MKLHNWHILNVECTQDMKDILCVYLRNKIIGSMDLDNSFNIYFDDIDKDKINNIIKNKTSIDNWKWSIIKEENWVQSSKDFFKPIKINNKVNIIPPWGNPCKNSLNIIINPALAFGTGHHETTYMMIESILNLDIKNKSVIDIGTGSGILSILSYELGAKSIYSLDNDELTENNFNENIKLNNINSNLNIHIKDCLELEHYNFDIILANINTGIILNLISKIKYNKQKLLLSGILQADETRVIKKLENNHFKIININRKEEWSCILAE